MFCIFMHRMGIGQLLACGWLDIGLSLLWNWSGIGLRLAGRWFIQLVYEGRQFDLKLSGKSKFLCQNKGISVDRNVNLCYI